MGQQHAVSKESDSTKSRAHYNEADDSLALVMQCHPHSVS